MLTPPELETSTLLVDGASFAASRLRPFQHQIINNQDPMAEPEPTDDYDRGIHLLRR
jgi:hypothetical protein